MAKGTGETRLAGALADALKAVRRHVQLTFAFSGAVNLLYLAPTIYMLQVYDRVLVTGGILTLIFLTIGLALALLSLALVDEVRNRIMSRLGLRLDRKLASPVLRYGLEVEPVGAQPRRPNQGLRDLENLRQGLTSPIALAVLDAPFSPLFMIIAWMIHPLLFVLVFVGALILVGLALLNERASRRSLQILAQTSPALFAAQEADGRAADTVRALGMRKSLIARRLNERTELLSQQMDASFTTARYAALTKFVRLALQSASLGLAAYLVIEREISTGAIIAAMVITTRAFAPVEQIVGGWRQLNQTFVAFRNLKGLLADLPPEQQRTPLPDPKGEIRVEGVSMRKPGSDSLALQGASLAASPGEIIGIVGPSGAGKSTLARVIAGASTPQAGAVRIDGARYVDWDRDVLARHIGYLPQEIDLFAGTIAENISRFAVDRGEDDRDSVGRAVVEAAQLAHAHEMILKLPQGYETKLAIGGRGLSPGQSQRVALARALFRQPKVLVLDEPNSHLDSEGEASLIAALKDSKERGAVSFVVAHRAGFMSIADKLLVLNDGRIEAFGPRDQVVAKLARAAGATPGPSGAIAPPHAPSIPRSGSDKTGGDKTGDQP